MKHTQRTAMVSELKKLAIEKERALWKRVALDLERPTRSARIVNLWKLEKHAKDGEILVVPGKLLGDGTLTKKLTVAAVGYSAEAKRKLAEYGCTALTIEELTRKHPDGKNVRIIG